MPLTHKIEVASSATLYIWQITENLTNLVNGLTDDDLMELNAISSDVRKAEKATWRRIVRDNISQDKIVYNNIGAPTLANAGHISVSHSGKFIAVLHSANAPCGVDAEHIGRNVERAKSRFISKEEQELPEAKHKLFDISVWCAKEAMYKHSQTTELDLIRDIKIIEANIDEGYIRGVVVDTTIDIRLMIINDHIVAYIV